MKLSGGGDTPAATAPPPTPQPATDSLDFGAESPAAPAGQEGTPAESDKPFEKEPFDAGIETSEESDPKKFIEQLSGKLGQSLRKYTEEQGQPDFELEKFVVNSALAATHTSQMDPEDQQDIIKKVETAGNDEAPEAKDEEPVAPEDDNTSSEEMGGEETPDLGEDPLAESNNFLIKPKKLSIFAPEGSEEAKFKHSIKEKLKESFQQDDTDMTQPTIEPTIKPKVSPQTTPTITPKPSRKNKPFLPPSPLVNPHPKAKVGMDEVTGKGKNIEAQIYHDSFSQAAQEADAFAKARGYEVDETDWFNQVATGKGRPDEGQTHSFSIGLTKDGVPQKKNLNFQVYGMKNKYELNVYIF